MSVVSRYSILRVFNQIKTGVITPFTEGGSVIIKGFSPSQPNSQTYFPFTSQELVDAVNALNSGGNGGLIVLNKGTYQVSQTLNLNGNIRITGGGTIEGSSFPIITLGGTGGNILEDVKVVAFNSGTGDTLVSIASDNNIIQDCYLTFDNDNDLGIIINLVGDNNLIRRCILSSDEFDVGNIASFGIIVEGQKNKVIGCVISAFQASIRSVLGTQIENNYSNNLLSTAGSHFQLTGTRFTIDSNVLLSGNIAMSSVSNSLITNNVMNCDSNAIFILGTTSNCVISGNDIFHNFVVVSSGISISGTFNGNLINDNMIREFNTPIETSSLTATDVSLISNNTLIQNSSEDEPILTSGVLGAIRYNYNNGATQTITRNGLGPFTVNLTNALADLYDINYTYDGAGAGQLEVVVPTLDSTQAGKVCGFNIAVNRTTGTANVRLSVASGFGFTTIDASAIVANVVANAVLVWTGSNWTINDNYVN